jgi:hypothetical protein
VLGSSFSPSPFTHTHTHTTLSHTQVVQWLVGADYRWGCWTLEAAAKSKQIEVCSPQPLILSYPMTYLILSSNPPSFSPLLLYLSFYTHKHPTPHTHR